MKHCLLMEEVTPGKWEDQHVSLTDPIYTTHARTLASMRAGFGSHARAWRAPISVCMFSRLKNASRGIMPSRAMYI